MVNAILPELADTLGTDVTGASGAVTAYMIPFSVLMVISGTVGARWGAARSVRFGLLLFSASSVLCMLSPGLGLFLTGRALQGVANAFTTPLLVAIISSLVPRERLGRSLGAYASFQAAGQAFAPLIGGVAAEINVRLAFAATALVALLLAVLIPVRQTRGATMPADWGALRNPRLVRSASVALCSQFAATSVMVLTALLVSDRFGLTPGERGLVVACFGLAGLLFGRVIGHLVDRFDVVPVGSVSLAILALSLALLGVTPGLVAVIALVSLGGFVGTAARILTNTLAIHSTPRNVGGATSLTMAAQFLGTAVMPAIIPLYHWHTWAAYAVAAAVAMTGAVLARIPLAAAST